MLLYSNLCGYKHSFDHTPTNIASITNITLNNGVFDEIFSSKQTSMSYIESSKKWDYQTIFYALFQNNLSGGNVTFSKETVSSVRVKRRKIGEFIWDTLFEIPIEENEDFIFERFDRFVRSNVDYQYSILPVINNVEGNPSFSIITPKFDGFFIIEKDVVFRAFINTQLSTQRNQNSTTISTLGRKKPFLITNGKSNYTSGQLEATFIDIVNCELDLENGSKYRELVDDFLSNSKPKILKDGKSGLILMVGIVDTIPQDYSQHWNMPIHTISFTEIGDAEDVNDLYDNSFIDIDSRLIR